MSKPTTTKEDLKFSEQFTEVNLTGWNPMQSDYSSKEFNSYFQPNTPEDYLEIYKTVKSPSQATPLKSISPTKGNQQEINLFLGNIPLSLTKEGLKSFLCQVAPVNSVRICRSKDPERGTTFGFTTVSSPRDAENIIKRFHNYSFGTRSNLHVKLALSSEERERQKEAQREEDEYYMNLCKDFKPQEENKEDMSVAASKSQLPTTNGVPADTKQNSPKKNNRVCVCCGKAGSKQCARCKACYCSSECQRVDWAKHQKQCLLVESSVSQETSVSNGETKKSSHNGVADIAEESLLLAVGDMEIKEKMFSFIKDLKAAKPLDSTIRVMIYVIDGLIMKGQAISETDTTALLEMTEKLGSYALGECDTFQEGECEQGMLVIVDYHGEISRATVTKCTSGSDEVEIYFIDYGNTEICKVSDLKPLPKFALELPMQCREFTLHNMPDNIDSNIKELLSQHLKELVLEQLLVAETKMTPDGSYQLIITGENGSMLVNESMLSFYKDLSAKAAKCSTKRTAESVPDSNSTVQVLLSVDIPVEPLPKEPDFKIIVTDVKSPSMFFAQVVTNDLSNLTDLANISERLQQFSSSAGSGFQPKQGQACIAFFPEDQMWYRASVNCFNDDGTVQVSYFDYGNCADIDTCFLRPIGDEFTSLPKQARTFCLTGIRPSSSDGKWSEAAIQLFKEKTSEEPCEVYNIGVVNDVCQLKVFFASEDCCADELLIKHGYAASDAEGEQVNPPENVAQTVPSAASQVISSQVETKSVNSKQFSLKPKKIDANDELRSAVVHVEDPFCFYVNVIEREAIETLMEYGGLMHEMTLSQLENPSPGDACCTLYTDGDWYRAKVISCGKDSSVVFFSDYGNESEIPNSSLKVMPEEVKSLPAQAVKVKLHDVMPLSNSCLWSDSAREFFSGLVSDKICNLKVIAVEDGVAICSVISEDDGCDVAKEIIKAGIASSASVIQAEATKKKPVSEPQDNQRQREISAAEKPSQVFKQVREEARPVVKEVKEEAKPVVKQMREEAKPVDKELKKEERQEKEKNPVSNNRQFTNFNKENDNANSGSPERENNASYQSTKTVNKPEYNRGHARGGSRGRGRGRGRGQSSPGGSFYPPFHPFSYYPFMYPPHPGMHFPVPEDDVSEQEEEKPYHNGTMDESESIPAWMKQQAYAMKKAHDYWTSAVRGRGGRGSRGGYNKYQNGYDDKGRRQHSRLPQEKVPSDYFTGANIDIIITHIKTPSRFYVIKEEDEGKDQLPMTTYQNEDAPSSVEEGMICASVIDGSCYRVVVERVYPEKVLVMLVDSGMNKVVSKSSLKRLAPDDFKRPFLAVKCILENACGLGKHRWSEEVIRYFMHKADIAGRKMKAVVRGEAPSGLRISIKDPENNEQFLVDDLVQQGFAKYMKEEHRR